jgi:hypothetical protein
MKVISPLEVCSILHVYGYPLGAQERESKMKMFLFVDVETDLLRKSNESKMKVISSLEVCLILQAQEKVK